MIRIKKVLRAWLPMAFIISILFGSIYLTVWQNVRQSANDPQIQIAQDYARILQDGKNPQEIAGQIQIDLSKSLSFFVIIFDDSGKPIVSQAVLDGRIPTPPKGVFEYVKAHKEDRITWEPKPGIRLASVLERFEGAKPGFILAGRSLKEIESRVDDLGRKLIIGWAVSILGSLVLIYLLQGRV